MKKTILRTFVAFLSVLFLLGSFALTACGKSAGKTLAAIKITRQPNTTVYVSGSVFKPDGMEVTAVYSNGKESTVTDFTYDTKKLTVDGDAFESVKTVTVSYTEKEITKSTAQKVTVTNKITNAVIKDEPKTEYCVGQRFDVSGMTITATLQNGSSKDISITRSNAKISPSGVLSRETESVTVTIGGYNLSVPVTILNIAYIEAEDGLLNGETPNLDSTEESGNLGKDSTLEMAQQGARALKEAEIQSIYIQSVINAFKATLKDTSAAGIAAAVEEYRNSDEYKNKIASYPESDIYRALIENYLASDEYAADIDKYHAHGDEYLGGLHQGDTVSFLFESSAAATGTIAFRLASSYLLRDDGEWHPIEMGDVPFNKLCEVRVNGIKCAIPDDVILEGGASPDGKPYQVLWVNWKEVPLDNISFVEGRNVIELEILHHGIKSPAHNDYDFAANIDSLLVMPDEKYEECEIGLFDDSRKMTQTVTGVSLENKNGRILATLSGEYSSVIGYVPDLFDIEVGGVKAELVSYGEGLFTLKADVTELPENDTYPVVVGGRNLSYSEDITLSKRAALGIVRYAMIEKNNQVVLEIDSNSSVLVESAVIETPVIGIEERGGKACYVIGGGVYSAQVIGYDMDDESDKELVNSMVAQLIKALYTFDLQENVENWDIYLKNAHTVNILEGNRFEVVMDVTSLKPGRAYATHFNHANPDGSFPTQTGKNDFKPSIDWFETETLMLSDGMCYRIKYEKGFAWDCVAVVVELKYSVNKTLQLEADEEEGKTYLVVSGTHTYTEEEFAKIEFYFDLQNPDTEWSRTDMAGKLTVTDNGNGTFTVKADITEIANGQYLAHCPDKDGDVGNENGIAEIQLGGRIYSYEQRNFGTWKRYVLTIKDAPEIGETV